MTQLPVPVKLNLHPILTGELVLDLMSLPYTYREPCALPESRFVISST